METENTLLDPQAALSSISRDELVNLLVDDALDRAQEELKRLNAECNEVAAKANATLLSIYGGLRNEVLRQLEPTLRAFDRALKMANQPAKAAVWGLAETPNIGGAYISDPTRPHGDDTMSLARYLTDHAQAALGCYGGKSLPTSCIANIYAKTDLSRAVLNLDVQIRVELPAPNLSEWRDLTHRVSDLRAAFNKLDAAVKEPDTLRRKGLAALTRQALQAKGIHLDGGLPTTRIHLPGLPG